MLEEVIKAFADELTLAIRGAGIIVDFYTDVDVSVHVLKLFPSVYGSKRWNQGQIEIIIRRARSSDDLVGTIKIWILNMSDPADIKGDERVLNIADPDVIEKIIKIL